MRYRYIADDGAEFELSGPEEFGRAVSAGDIHAGSSVFVGSRWSRAGDTELFLAARAAGEDPPIRYRVAEIDGQLTEAQLLRRIEEGSIRLDAPVRSEKMAVWLSVTEVPALRKRLLEAGLIGPAPTAEIEAWSPSTQDPPSERHPDPLQTDMHTGPTEGIPTSAPAPRSGYWAPRRVVGFALLVTFLLGTLAGGYDGPWVIGLVALGSAVGIGGYWLVLGRGKGRFEAVGVWGASVVGCLLSFALTVGFTEPGDSGAIARAIGFGLGSGLVYGIPLALVLGGVTVDRHVERAV